MLQRTVDTQILFTNKARCRDCYRCLRNCPVNAIKMKDGQASVESDKCILCGTCLKECPQNAKQFRHDLERVKRLIQENDNVAVSIAPSFPALFEDWQIERIPSLMRRLGFSYVSETAEAAYFVAEETKDLFLHKGKGICLSSACPSYVTYVEKYQPQHVKNLTTVVSPMIAHARRLRKKLTGNWKIVFIGPCVAKKAEAERNENKNAIDAVLTFTELLEWIEEEKIDLKQFEASEFDEKVTGDARLYALTGGMSKTASLETDNLNTSVFAMSGFNEITDSMRSFTETSSRVLIEPLICPSGCVNGPGLPNTETVYLRKEKVINYAKSKFNSEKTTNEIDVSLTTSFNNGASVLVNEFEEEEIRNVLDETGKQDLVNQLNCGACGYSTCLENAKAILNGMVEIESCIPYMRRLAEQRMDKIIETSPNGLVILNRELEILHMNPAFKKFFMCTNSVAGKRISYLMDPEPFIKLKDSDTDMVEVTINHSNYNVTAHQILYKLPEENQYIGIFVDITKNVTDVEKLDSLRVKTIQQAQELLDHQIEMAQALAKLLGESTAKGEELVDNLLKLTQDEKDQKLKKQELAVGYQYYEVITEQISKRPEKPSGDVTLTVRDKSATVHILCDGVGSGIKANIAATMSVARLNELLKSGFTLRQAFATVIHTMEEARKKDLPCAFFTMMRVLSDGVAVILNYDMPEALFVSKRYSTHLKSSTQSFNDGIVSETSCTLNKGEGVLLMSDGITQAGMGKGFPYGWGIDAVNKFVNDQLRNGAELKNLPKLLISEARRKWKNQCEDDLTVSLIYCRKGRVVNIFTGPPINADDDEKIVKQFLSNDGLKIVCGASTAKIVARVMKKDLEFDPAFKSNIAPPSYEIEGLDLVTEGAVTLNQLYNVWGEGLESLEKNSPVTDLHALLNVADRINFILGKSKNPAGDDISFKQSGILKRDKIVPLLIQKFREDGKIVTIEEV